MTRTQTGLVDRAGWDPGPWDDEPDRVDWTDPATGYPCLIIRHAIAGNLCGYVAVPSGHPWHGQDWTAEDSPTDHVAVHQGVTFSAPCRQPEEYPPGHPRELAVCHVPEPGQPDDVWWFGFHCASAFDIQPGLQAHMRAAGLGGWPGTDLGRDHPLCPAYRTLAYVQDQCTALAAQLAERA